MEIRKSTAIADTAALGTAITNDSFELVTGFVSANDEFNLAGLGLAGVSAVVTSLTAAYTALATNDVVILNETVSGDLDGDTDNSDYFVIVDTAGDNSTVGIFKVNDAIVAVADIDLV